MNPDWHWKEKGKVPISETIHMDWSSIKTCQYQWYRSLHKGWINFEGNVCWVLSVSVSVSLHCLSELLPSSPSSNGGPSLMGMEQAGPPVQTIVVSAHDLAISAIIWREPLKKHFEPVINRPDLWQGGKPTDKFCPGAMEYEPKKLTIF